MHAIGNRWKSDFRARLYNSRLMTRRIRRLAIMIGVATWSAAPSTYAQAIDPPPTSVTLPADEAPHHNLTEWWYFTGHLAGTDPQGKVRKYGFEVTVFQVFTTPNQPALYSAHFAITDHQRRTFKYEPSVAVQPIPNQANGFALNINDQSISGGSGSYVTDTVFSDNSYSLRLNLNSTAPPVVHGTNGIIPYPGFGTSAYFSYTSLGASGVLTDHGVPITVTGIAWQDRQWFNNAPGGGIGWNWFSIQLQNNVQYTLYYIQDSAGTIIQPIGTEVVNGVAKPIPADKMSLTALSHWTSPTTGRIYPSKWELNVPNGQFIVTPVIPNQELVAPGHDTYYEADSTVRGIRNGLPVVGVAYSEVKPYAVPDGTTLP